jgi:sugar lactone lactonase YvrE
MRLSIEHLGPAQRRLVYFMFMIGGVMLLLAITLFLASLAVNSGDRVQSQGLRDGMTSAEFALLPDDDAYPAAVAVAPDGTIYTGSYATGAVWALDADGTPQEIPDSRDVIGAVAGLTVAPDGTVFVVDQVDTDPRSIGGRIVRILPDGTVEIIIESLDDDVSFITPDDIALDSTGLIYVTERGHNAVWRFDADGSNGVAWWTPPESTVADVRGAVTGIAYDATTNQMLVTDPDLNLIYRVDVATADGEIVFRYTGDPTQPPGFDGLTVTPDGEVYIAALGQNGIAWLTDNDDIIYIAGNYRGASDVAFAEPDTLYVTNFDQASLALPLVKPQLPFALDVIDLGGE